MKPSSQSIVCAKTLTLLTVIAALLISTTAAVSSYSRFAPSKSHNVENGRYAAINEHHFNRIPTRYYGRFRNGNSDVLARYLSNS